MAMELEKLAARAVADAGGHHPCSILGHEWQSIGGMNAGCHKGADWCGCSVPVNECRFCGDCDYGDNEDAERVRMDCARATQGSPQ